MTGDFKQNGENFTIEGKDFFFYRGESEDSVGVNLKNSTGYWHLSAPRTWEDRNPLSIFWIDNTTWHGPFFSINTDGHVTMGPMQVNIDGNVGIGTNHPVRKLHIEGSEMHSGGDGAGYSFSDRSVGQWADYPENGERWVWYANNGMARLWSGSDKLSITKEGNLFLTGNIMGEGLTLDRGEDQSAVALNLKNPTGYWHLSGPRTWEDGNPLSIFWIDHTTWHGPFLTINTEGTVGIRHLSVGEVNRELMIVPQEEQDPVSLMLMNGTGLWRMIGPVSSEPGNPLWIGWQDREDWHGPSLSITTDGQVSVRGDFKAATVAQTSSKTLKENIAELSEQEAVETLTGLNPVKFNFKADQQKELHVGFIAEDVPDLVAMADRQTLSPMEIVAVLTKVVQQQQQAISALTAEVRTLKQQVAAEQQPT